jgi:hypothetical protein
MSNDISDPNDPFEHGQKDRDPATGIGKYLLLKVTDFKANHTPPMDSYLRLGDADPNAGQRTGALTDGTTARAAGEDLAGLVHGFTDDTRARAGTGPLPGDTCPPLTDSNGSSLDTIAARRQESMKLHTKGGWRDHSDGNRITTTRGDKVEVIRGNYKMVVLGRSEAWGNAAGMEIAGGNLDTSSADLEFGKDPDDLGDTSGSLHGRSQGALEVQYIWEQDAGDQRWSWTQITRVGSDDTTHSDDAKASPGNNRIISSTWVDYMETNVGSGGKPVFDMKNNTYATTFEEVTNVGRTHTIRDFAHDQSESLTVTATHTVDTTAQDQNETLNVAGTHNATIYAGTENETIYCGTLTTDVHAENFDESSRASDTHSVSTAAGHLHESLSIDAEHTVTNFAAVNFEFDVSLMSVQIQVALLITEIKFWSHFDLHIGVHYDGHLGTHVDVHAGQHYTLDAVPSVEISAGKSILAGLIAVV